MVRIHKQLKSKNRHKQTRKEINSAQHSYRRGCPDSLVLQHPKPLSSNALQAAVRPVPQADEQKLEDERILETEEETEEKLA